MTDFGSDCDFSGGVSGVSGFVMFSECSSDEDDEDPESVVDAVADAGTCLLLQYALETTDSLRAALAALVKLLLLPAMGAAAASSFVAAAAVQVLSDMMGCGIVRARKTKTIKMARRLCLRPLQSVEASTDSLIIAACAALNLVECSSVTAVAAVDMHTHVPAGGIVRARKNQCRTRSR